MYKIRKLDEQAIENAEKKWNSIAKPLHSLGVFEDIVKYCGYSRNTKHRHKKEMCTCHVCR